MVEQTASSSLRLLIGVSVAILLVTLTPMAGSREAVSTFCILCGTYGTADFVLNVMIFVPLGYLTARVINSEVRALIFVVCATVVIEIVQNLIPGRYPTLGDVVANAIGGSLGIWTMRVRSVRPVIRLFRGQQAAARAAPFALTAALVLTVVLLRPALPDTIYYGQWTADLGQFAQYDGQVHSVRVGTVDIPGHRLETSATQAIYGIAQGAPLTLDFLAGSPTPDLAPILSVFDEHQVEVLVVGVDSEAIVVRMRRRAESLDFHAPEVRFERLHPTEGIESTIRLTYADGAFCIRLEGVKSCRSAATPARGWSLFTGISLPSWASGFLDAAWLALLGLVTIVMAARTNLTSFGAVRAATWFLPIITYGAMWLLLGGDPTWVPGLAGLVAGSMVGVRICKKCVNDRCTAPVEPIVH